MKRTTGTHQGTTARWWEVVQITRRLQDNLRFEEAVEADVQPLHKNIHTHSVRKRFTKKNTIQILN